MRDDRDRPPEGPHDHAARFGAPDFEGMPIEVLRRYVRLESDAVERRRVQSWAAEWGGRQWYLDAMRNLLERAPSESRSGAEAAWSRLAARLDERPAPASARPALGRLLPSRRRSRSAALLAAAALIAALAASVLLDRAGAHRASPSAETVAMRIISTATGQRADIRLSDGSRVSLGVASRLRLAPDFGERSRDVYLDGTAYFDVVHDSTRPFRVHTSTAVTQDVGTRFVITAYPGSGSTQVVVAEGAVTLRAPNDSAAHAIQLGAGNLARIAQAGTPVMVRAVDPAQYTAWMDGRLVFHDTPLSDVVAELHRWYDEDVRIGDSTLARLPLSASFDVESFDQSVRVITTVLPLRAVRRDGVVTLYRR
ncbi:MAG TPA: FecR domain-containing protein [Gemmatimonadaceae bacterium]|nr:FecR domain-containing protein [Gemmatimonadaceae bacterium]